MDYRQAIINTANRLGVPPEVALSVAIQESGMRHYDSAGNVIRGQAGEIGMFQLMPFTAVEMLVNPWDPMQNIEGGVGYLRKMYGMTGGSWKSALEAYNGGIGNWQKGLTSSDARLYAQQVLARAPGVSTPSESPGFSLPPILPTSPSLPTIPDDGGLVFSATAEAPRPPNTALLLVLGLLGAVVVSQT